MYRLIYFIPIWVLCHLLGLMLYLLGWILIPIATYCNAYGYMRSKVTGQMVYTWTWPFMWLWGNDEDGIDAGVQYWKAPSHKIQIIYWCAQRNPVNNLRYAPYLSCKIIPDKVSFRGSFSYLEERGDFNINDWMFKYATNQYDTKITQWFLAWQGPHSNFYWQFKVFGQLWRFWVGTAKIYPTDIYGVTPYRKFGTGGVLQLKRIV